MKKKYIVPKISVSPVLAESLLDSASGGSYWPPRNNSNGARKSMGWNFYEDEEENSSFPQSKSVWDD